jgi:antitoxin (DNA-binding transcriptional repressor) of toxin-antitoxin stability system
MESHITATEAARSFSDLLNRVHYRGESFVIERGGAAVCRLVPAGPAPCTVADLVHVLRSLPHVDEEFGRVVEGLTRKQPKMARNPWAR